MPAVRYETVPPPASRQADRRCAVLIVGAGLAGLSTALHLERSGFADYLVIEAEDRPGGWAKTDWSGPWGADRAIHVLYFRDGEMRKMVEEVVGGALADRPRRTLVDSAGVRTPYPFHAHLHGRAPETVLECLHGLWQASLDARDGAPPPVTFADWIVRHQGAGVARHFMEPYNHKLWTVPPSEMGWEWIGSFIPAADPRSFLAGALGTSLEGAGLNSVFVYPEGGISALADGLCERVRPIRFQTRLATLDAAGHRATFDDGTRVRYDALVSTVPLPRLVEMLESPPADVLAGVRRLEATDLVLVDVGFADPADRETHWVYLPDREVLAHRLHQVHALSTALVPDGHGLYCVEVAHSRHRPLPDGDVAERVIGDLVRARWLRSRDQVAFVRTRRFPCAYAIPRLGAADDVHRAREYLRSLDIHSVGRYGTWRYSNQEDALLDGRHMAARLLNPTIE